MKTMHMTIAGVVAAMALACGGGNTPDAKTAGTGGDAPSTEAKASGAGGGGGANDLGDLEYKRVTDGIKGDFAKYKAKFKELCGADVDVDVDWASFGRDKDTLSTFSSNYGVERLVMGFESVCHDKAGKEAVQKKVKKIRAVNIKDPKNVKVTISGGTMTAELNWSGSSPGMNENDLGAAITKSL